MNALHKIHATEVIAAVAILFFLKEARPVFVPIVLALALMFILVRPVHYLHSRRVPIQLAALIVLAATCATVAVLILLLTPIAKEWLAFTADNLQGVVDLLDRLRDAIPGLDMLHGKGGKTSEAAANEAISARLAGQGLDFASDAVVHGTTLLFSGVITLILLLLLLISERWIISQVLRLLPTRRRRAKMLAGLRDIQRDIYHFFFTMSGINLGLAVATSLTLAWIDMPNPVFWGATVGLLNFIPYFGPMLSTLLLFLASVTTFKELPMIFAPPLCFVGLAAVESNIISPIVVGRRLQLNPLAIFFTVLLLGWLWGVVGAFLTVPFLAAVRCIARYRNYRLIKILLSRGEATPVTFQEIMALPDKEQIKEAVADIATADQPTATSEDWAAGTRLAENKRRKNF